MIITRRKYTVKTFNEVTNLLEPCHCGSLNLVNFNVYIQQETGNPTYSASYPACYSLSKHMCLRENNRSRFPPHFSISLLGVSSNLYYYDY